MLKELTLEVFVDIVDSKEPAPGGGSVSALVGSIACALARMYGHLSIGKKAYEANPTELKERFQASFEELHVIETKLMALVDEDTDIFKRFMEAVRLPKETEQQLAIRNKAMEIAMKEAIESPLSMIELCFDGMKSLEAMVGYGNANAVSDIGVAVACFEAAAKGAYLNVIINLKGLQDDELAYVFERKAKLKLEQVCSMSFDFYTKIRNLMK